MLSKYKIITLLSLLISSAAFGQRTTKDSTRSVQLYGMGPGIYQPFADLNNRYTAFGSMTGEWQYKLRSNWIFGLSYDVWYGKSVKNYEEIFSFLADDNGNFIGVNGEYALLDANLLGHQAVFTIGQIFPGEYNPNSGWYWRLGVGMQQSQITIYNLQQNYPQLLPPMVHGYDRLHRGGVLQWRVGKLHLGNRERINYAYGFSLNTAITQSVRGFNVDQNLPDTNIKADLSAGLYFTWYIPVYPENKDFYYTH